MIEHMLTTDDNPHDPFVDWDAWYAFDERAGYHTTAYLGRVVVTSDELSETDQQLAIERAIDEIVEMNVLGIYKKVSSKAGVGSEKPEEAQMIEETSA